jgi:Replication initiator protein, pSAM2
VNTEEDQAVELLVEVLGAVIMNDPLSASPPSSNHGNDAESKEDDGGERQQAGAPPLGVGNPSGHQHGEEHPDDQVAQPRRLSHSVSMRGVQHRTRTATRGRPPNQPAPPIEAHTALVARAGRPDYDRWLSGARSAGGCVRPVRLRPSILRADPSTGELTPAGDGSTEAPDGVLYKACGDRRASVCPPCAETYRQDTWQLIAAGLRGGKGVPTEVAGHPAVFLTLTAPSFGLVHTRRTASTGRVLPCRPRRKPAPCPHGIDLRCGRHHDRDESVLGLPLCLDCYDHAGQVVWNAHVGELWRRAVIGLRRELARAARSRGTTVRLSYAKVAEFQRRGVVHLHALLRLDGIDPADRERIAPPAGVVLGDLVDAVQHAAKATAFVTEGHDERPAGWPIDWGEQLDIRPLRLRGNGDVTDSAVVAYLVKYATKSTESTGHVSKRLTASTVDYYADPDTHAGRLVDACWTLGGVEGWDGLRRWAHMLGFGGHFGTRSRRYSTTLRALRAARRVWRRRELVETREHAEETTLVVGSWSYAGVGWRSTADALLATSAAARARERRRTARDELSNR